MTIAVRISYDTAQASRDLSAYRINIDFDAEDGPASTGKRGPTFNDSASYCGAFSSWRDAAQAIADFIPRPFSMIESNTGSHLLKPVDYRPDRRAPHGRCEWLLIRKLPTGLYISDENEGL